MSPDTDQPVPGSQSESAHLTELAMGAQGIKPRNVARIFQSRAASAGLDRCRMRGHSLKRGALTTGMDNSVYPMGHKQLGQHERYNVLDGYLELGENRS